MKASAIKRRIDKHAVGVQLTAEELAAVDLVAARINPACPKRSEALRHLLMLGYQEFRRLNDHRGLTPPPSLGADLTKPPSMAGEPSLPRDGESAKGENHG